MKFKKLVTISMFMLTVLPSCIEAGFGSGFGGGLLGGMVGGAMVSGPRTREVYVNSDNGYYQTKCSDLEYQIKMLNKQLKKQSKSIAKYKKLLNKYVKLIKKYMKLLTEKGVTVKDEIKGDVIDFDDTDDNSGIDDDSENAE